MAALLGLPVLGAGLPGGLVAGAVALAASRLVHSSAALASSEWQRKPEAAAWQPATLITLSCNSPLTQSFQVDPLALAGAVQARRSLHCAAALLTARLPPAATAGLPAPAPLRPDPASLVLDLTAPASWYPAARALRRRVVFHAGPTNSGKTHAALQSLKKVRERGGWFGGLGVPVELLSVL